MLGANIGYYIPVAAESKSQKSGYGFQGQIEIKITSYIGLALTSGYIFIPTVFDSENKSIEIFPIMIGGRFYWFDKGIKPYTGLDFCMYACNYNYDMFYYNNYDYSNYSDTKIGFSILQGALFPINDNFFINGNILLTSASADGIGFNCIAIHAGVSVIL
jgi:hypothetical protein